MRGARGRATGALPDDDGACRAGQLEQGPQRGVRDQPPLHGQAGPSGDGTAELLVQVTRRLIGWPWLAGRRAVYAACGV
jgi:hypothetical protein